jgi:mannose-6-phosphate isomerase-like protein (cupin superfamily)
MKISKNNAEHYIWGDQCDGWHLVNHTDLSVIHERMPAGTSEARHYHSVSRQFFFVISGTAAMQVDGVTEILNASEGIEIPPKAPHQMMNRSDEDLQFLVISAPHSRGDRIVTE